MIVLTQDRLKKNHQCGRLLDLFLSLSNRNASLDREEFIYRINDSPEGMEAAQHRKHMLNGVCNGGQLEKGREVETEVWRGEKGETNTFTESIHCKIKLTDCFFCYCGWGDTSDIQRW